VWSRVCSNCILFYRPSYISHTKPAIYLGIFSCIALCRVKMKKQSYIACPTDVLLKSLIGEIETSADRIRYLKPPKNRLKEEPHQGIKTACATLPSRPIMRHASTVCVRAFLVNGGHSQSHLYVLSKIFVATFCDIVLSFPLQHPPNIHTLATAQVYRVCSKAARIVPAQVKRRWRCFATRVSLLTTPIFWKREEKKRDKE